MICPPSEEPVVASLHAALELGLEPPELETCPRLVLAPKAQKFAPEDPVTTANQ